MDRQTDNIVFEDEIISEIKKMKPTLSDASLKWELYSYAKDNSLVKIGKKKYLKNGKLYDYNYSSGLAKEIDVFLSSKYKNIKIVVWESKQLNEWLNLLLTTNVIYVEVEKDYLDYIFSSLNEKFGKSKLILLNPDGEIVSRYLREDLVIVRTLYSKSPILVTKKTIRLEKLVVDVYCDSILLDYRGKCDVISGIKDSYDINVDKMFAYASRRRVKKELLEMWGD